MGWHRQFSGQLSQENFTISCSNFKTKWTSIKSTIDMWKWIGYQNAFLSDCCCNWTTLYVSPIYIRNLFDSVSWPSGIIFFLRVNLSSYLHAQMKSFASPSSCRQAVTCENKDGNCVRWQTEDVNNKLTSGHALVRSLPHLINFLFSVQTTVCWVASSFLVTSNLL